MSLPYEDDEIFSIGGQSLRRGEQATIMLKLPRLFDFTQLAMPVRIFRGLRPGPAIFVSGAIHGDEVIGPEIIKRVMLRLAKGKRMQGLSGTLVFVPIVNVFGFNANSRYLPDHRDLNRSFPGSKDGSLAARVAAIFLDEVVRKCHAGIDLHSAKVNRVNLPQIRVDLSDPITDRLARAFGAPVILNSKVRDGSLREVAEDLGIHMLVFEGGEGLRSNEAYVKIGVKGVINVLREAGNLPSKKRTDEDKNNSGKDTESPEKSSFVAQTSYWLRASQSGSIRSRTHLGAIIKPDSVLAEISDPFGENIKNVKSRTSGIVIGESLIPLINQGDALFHIATGAKKSEITRLVEEFPDLLSWYEAEPVRDRS
jgi:predicted deacylase